MSNSWAMAQARNHPDDNDRRDILSRINYLRGQIEGIRMFAIWKDGQQLVGCLQRPLEEVLKPIEDEIKTLEGKLK